MFSFFRVTTDENLNDTLVADPENSTAKIIKVATGHIL
jgi:hypothetical protein